MDDVIDGGFQRRGGLRVDNIRVFPVISVDGLGDLAAAVRLRFPDVVIRFARVLVRDSSGRGGGLRDDLLDGDLCAGNRAVHDHLRGGGVLRLHRHAHRAVAQARNVARHDRSGGAAVIRAHINAVGLAVQARGRREDVAAHRDQGGGGIGLLGHRHDAVYIVRAGRLHVAADVQRVVASRIEARAKHVRVIAPGGDVALDVALEAAARVIRFGIDAIDAAPDIFGALRHGADVAVHRHAGCGVFAQVHLQAHHILAVGFFPRLGGDAAHRGGDFRLSGFIIIIAEPLDLQALDVARALRLHLDVLRVQRGLGFPHLDVRAGGGCAVGRGGGDVLRLKFHRAVVRLHPDAVDHTRGRARDGDISAHSHAGLAAAIGVLPNAVDNAAAAVVIDRDALRDGDSRAAAVNVIRHDAIGVAALRRVRHAAVHVEGEVPHLAVGVDSVLVAAGFGLDVDVLHVDRPVARTGSDIDDVTGIAVERRAAVILRAGHVHSRVRVRGHAFRNLRLGIAREVHIDVRHGLPGLRVMMVVKGLLRQRGEAPRRQA